MSNHPFRKSLTRRRGEPMGRGEPKTKEGRARKKLQLGMAAGFGCVLGLEEMKTVVAALPKGWMERECK